MNPTSNFEQITPKYAAELLQHNSNNRSPKPNSIRSYLRQMQSNEFAVNGETIKFDTNGVLLDGQNRLIAISRMPENYSYNALVVRNLPPESFKTIDIGSMRSAADIVYLAGHRKYSRHIAAVIRKHDNIFIKQQNTNKEGEISIPDKSKQLTPSDCVRIYESHKELIDDIIPIAYQSMAKSIVSAPLAAAVMIRLIKDNNEDKLIVFEFFETLYSGASLPAGDKLLEIRNKLIKMHSRSIKFNELVVVKLLINGYLQYKKRQN